MRYPETRQIAWDFIRQNWDKVQAQITTGVGAYLISGAGAFCSEEKKQEAVDFFSAHPVPASGTALQRAKDSIDDCVQLRALQGPKLEQWIAAQ
jgi:aminopeptidase N/puromycin-sensitive aminopeptidase